MASDKKPNRKELEKKYPVTDYKKSEDWTWEHPGRPTGSIPKLVEAPVKWLLTLPGLRGEHKVLSYDMPKIKKLSELVTDPQWRKENPCEIGVQHDGKPYVDDGNHRIRAAKLAGLKTYPIKVKFYGGGEDHFNIADILVKHAAELKLKPGVTTPEDLVRMQYMDAPHGTWPVSHNQDKAPSAIVRKDYGPTMTREIDNPMAPTLEQTFSDHHPPTTQAIPNNKQPRFELHDNRESFEEFNPDMSAKRLVRQNSLNHVVDMAQQVMNSGIDWGKMFEQLVHNKPVVDGLVDKVKNTVPAIPKLPKGATPPMNEKMAHLQSLIAKAKIAIEAGLPYDSVVDELKKFAIENDIGGNSDQYGVPVDQDYAADSTQGADYAGENDPNKGDQRRTGPREPNDMIQEASSNGACPTCGMPTDKCNCMKSEQPRNGNNPVNTAPKVDPALDPTKKIALNLLTSMIAAHGKMTREASHVEEIEIPFKDLNLEDGVNYHMSGRTQEASMSIDKYLKAHVYPHVPYTIVTMEQTMNKMFVKCIVFDRQIEHEANDTKDDSLRKVSNVQSQKLQKTAWKRRLTEVIGENDDTGLVRCPIEGGFLTRSCGTCPLAGNPHTYAVDGGVECHFDDMTDWLGGGRYVKEHRLLDSSSNK